MRARTPVVPAIRSTGRRVQAAGRLWPAARNRLLRMRGDRGDVPGWVLVTLMTAGLVVTLWAVAGPRFEEVFNDAMDRVVGGP